MAFPRNLQPLAMPLPNFFVVGAAKAGTSSLWHYLQSHPSVFMSPIKEPKFFQWDGEPQRFSGPIDERIYRRSVTDFDEYRNLFASVDGETAIGEASPSYLYSPDVAERIHRRLPEARVIIILRQPATRAFSHFLHNRRMECEPLERFEQALAEEDERRAQDWGPNWHYRAQGYYHDQVSRYIERFGRDRVKIRLFDELQVDSAAVVHDLFEFLGVDPDQPVDTRERSNENLFPRSRVLQSLVDRANPVKAIARIVTPHGFRRRIARALRRGNKTRRIPPPTRVIERLTAEYEDDIHRLENLIQRDLSGWLSRAPARS